MKIVVFSDIHGNLAAFEKMLHANSDADMYISLGDVVNYSPFSNECVDLLETLPNTIKLIGNHEEAFITGKYEGKHPIAQAFFQTTFPIFNRKETILSYKSSYENFGFCFVHTILDSYIYPNSEIIFNKNYMIGHSHRQYILKSRDNILYNPGSIGQNRMNIQMGQYLIFYPETKIIEMKSIDYDFNTLIKEMKNRKYPHICIDYFLSKNK